MIVHVLRRAEEAGIGRVAVATDTPEIAAAVKAAGGEAVMTRADHPSGSDRIHEAMRTTRSRRPGRDRGQPAGRLSDDRPGHHPRRAAAARRPRRRHRDAGRADPYRGRGPTPSVVKAVGSPIGPNRLRALYFTRATAPHGDGPRYHHIGLYAYRRAALERFVALPPSPLEQQEKLEQLRALEAGMRIDIALVDSVPRGVDTAGRPRNRPQMLAKPEPRYKAPHDQEAENRIPGRAGRQFPYRHRRGLSRRRAAALRRPSRTRCRRDRARARPTSA